MSLRQLRLIVRLLMVGLLGKISLWICALIFYSSSLCCAQSIGYNHVKYSTEDGLPSSEVYEIIQDREGYLWFATDAGVSRYDGYDFTNYTTNDGLTDNTVFHFYEDFQGRIWFLTFNSQLCYFENDSIHHYKYNEQLKQVIPAQWIRAISIDTDGALTFAGSRFGFGTVSADGVFEYETKTGEEFGTVGDYRNGDDLLIYSLNSKNRSTLKDSVWFGDQSFELSYTSSSDRNRIGSQFDLGNGKFFFGLGGNICYFDGDQLKVKHARTVLTAIHLDQRNRVWVACYNEGIKIFENIEALFDGAGPLNHIYPDKNISNVFSDNEGGLWLAVQNSGVFYITNPAMEVYSCGQGELDNRVSSLFSSGDGKIYAGTYNCNVYEVQADSLPKLLIENASGFKNTIYNFRASRNEEGVVEMSLGAVLKDRNGGIWNIGDKFIRLMSEVDTIVYKDARRSQVRFNTAFEDRDGKIWAGSNSGLYTVKGQDLEEFKLLPELVDVRVEDIDQLDDGTMIFAIKGRGIIFWKEGTTRMITSEDGLSSDIIKNVHVDEDQEIWVSTTTGLNRLTRSSDGNYKIHSFSGIHGLPTIELNKVISKGYMIWAATNKGIVRFDKRKLLPNTQAPNVQLNHVSINEEQQEILSEYEFPYNQNYIEIGFTALSFRSLGNVRYRYKMEWIDEEWIETNTRSVRYPSLADGDYIFHVKAANEDGVWSDEKTLMFRINPPFWKTWWFVLLCIALVVGFVAIIVRSREQRRRKKAEQERVLEQQKLMAVKSELKALRAQMNPHFTFNTLSAIQTAVNNADAAKASKYIVDFATLIRKVLENSKYAHIKLEEELEMLRLYIELEQLRFSNRFDFEVAIDGKLDSSFVKIPSMVIQPYVENAIIHGLAPKKEGGMLELKLEMRDEQMICVVQDNGIGRTEALKIKKRKALVHTSMAMEITEERLDLYKQEMGQDFSVKIIDLTDEQNIPNGTRVELVFPI